jgi:asparagine synthase (glutamine-hydrolysing)
VVPTAERLVDELPAVVDGQEEPFGSASIYAQWCVMRAARDAGVTVLLDGQGADELFGGYPSAIGWALRSQGLVALAQGIALRPDRSSLLIALGSEGFRLPQRMVGVIRRRHTSPYAAVAVRHAVERIPRLHTTVNGFRSPLARELVRQSFFTSLPDLLRYADRNSMAHSREVRLPFLDRRIAEFAYSLPSEFLFRDGVTKAVLRDAVRGLVPSEVLDRRDKVGYEPPQAQWFSEPAFTATVAEVLLDYGARARGLYAIDAIEADLHAGRWRDPTAIWRALNLELWLRSFVS